MKRMQIFLLLISLSVTPSLGRGQQLSEPPPEPYDTTTTSTVPGSECVENPTGTGSPPPPPGLCLPINDYLLPLLLSGSILGSFYMLKIQKKEQFRNEAPLIF